MKSHQISSAMSLTKLSKCLEFSFLNQLWHILSFSVKSRLVHNTVGKLSNNKFYPRGCLAGSVRRACDP